MRKCLIRKHNRQEQGGDRFFRCKLPLLSPLFRAERPAVLRTFTWPAQAIEFTPNALRVGDRTIDEPTTWRRVSTRD
jgi:hypothetical protein